MKGGKWKVVAVFHTLSPDGQECGTFVELERTNFGGKIVEYKTNQHRDPIEACLQ